MEHPDPRPEARTEEARCQAGSPEAPTPGSGDGAPSFERLRTAIQSRLDTLTPTERHISNHFVERPHSVALMSIQELAVLLETGPASIVRLAKKLGYRGYSQLKRDLKQEMAEDRSPLERFKRSLGHRHEEGAKGLPAIARQEMENITATLGLVDAASLASAVAIVRKASVVHTAGVGISFHLAGMAAYVLQHIGLRAFAVPQTGLSLAEQLANIRRDEALLTFCFPPYSPQTIDAAALAKGRGTPVIGITNQTISPLAERCDVVLVARTASHVPSNSVSAPMMLVHAIAAAVASAQPRKSSRAIERTLSLREAGPEPDLTGKRGPQ